MMCFRFGCHMAQKVTLTGRCGKICFHKFLCHHSSGTSFSFHDGKKTVLMDYLPPPPPKKRAANNKNTSCHSKKTTCNRRDQHHYHRWTIRQLEDHGATKKIIPLREPEVKTFII